MDSKARVSEYYWAVVRVSAGLVIVCRLRGILPFLVVGRSEFVVI